MCFQCCMTKSKSPLPQAEILQRISEPGSCVSIACTSSEHLKARPAGVAVRRRRIGASVLFGPILSPIGQLLPEEGACVTGLSLLSPLLHDEEQKPPSTGRGWRRRRRRIGASVLFGPILSPIGQLLPEEGACVTGFPSLPHCHSERSEESRYKSRMRQILLNTNRREGCRLADWQSGRRRVSIWLAASYTPAPLRGPLRPAGKHVTGFSGRFAPLQHGYHRLTGFSGLYCSPTNPVRWSNSSSFAT